LEWDLGPGIETGHLANEDVEIDFTDKTFCSTVYIRWSDGMVAVSTNFKGKAFSDGLVTDPHPRLELEMGDNVPTGGLECSIIKSSSTEVFQWDDPKKHTVTIQGSDAVTVDDCSDKGWCEASICFDHNFDSNDTVRSRCRIRALWDGSIDTASEVSTTSNATALVPDGGDGRNYIYRYHTEHEDVTGQKLWTAQAMQMVVPVSTDGTWWPLPAPEIESTPTPRTRRSFSVSQAVRTDPLEPNNER